MSRFYGYIGDFGKNLSGLEDAAAQISETKRADLTYDPVLGGGNYYWEDAASQMRIRFRFDSDTGDGGVKPKSKLQSLSREDYSDGTPEYRLDLQFAYSFGDWKMALSEYDPTAAWDHKKKGIKPVLDLLAPGFFDYYGSPENDYLIGVGHKINTLDGDAGDDTVRVFPGKYNVDGGADTDTLDVADWAKGLKIDLDANTFRFGGLKYVSTITNVENVDATNKNDLVIGNAVANMVNLGGGNDRAITGGGDDVVDGGKGNDKIKTGAGNDVLDGGPGNDTYKGDADEDLFRMDDTPVRGFGRDVIRDYSLQEDRLYVGGFKPSFEFRTLPKDLVFARNKGDLKIKTGDSSIVLKNIKKSDFFAFADFEIETTKGVWRGKTASRDGSDNDGTEFDDHLFGGVEIDGRAGDDEIVFRVGTGYAYGDAGHDIFDISAAEGASVIDDYTDGEDRIRVKADLLSDITKDGNGNVVFNLVGGHTVTLSGTSALAIGDIDMI